MAGICNGGEHSGSPSPSMKKKVIIDTDPGIDDAMAIFMAFQSPELEVIGLTTVFGNTEANIATRNALYLCEIAGFPDVPVAEGSSVTLRGTHPHISDFAHGSDGLGNTFSMAQLSRKKSEKCASDFLIEKVQEFPNEVTIVALGPLTNIAEAIQKDKLFASRIKQLFVLGGSFFASGNINPAAEANIYCDPEAADIVLTSGADITVLGINLTTQVIFTESHLCDIKEKGRYGKYIYDMCNFYKGWHLSSDGFEGIYLHDPTCMLAAIDSTLFTYKKGVVRVETEGICRGHTILDLGLKIWTSPNPWTDISPITIGWTVDAEGVIRSVKKRLEQP